MKHLQCDYLWVFSLTTITVLSMIPSLTLGQGADLKVKAYLLEKANDYTTAHVFRYSQLPAMWNNIPRLLMTKNVAEIQQICVVGPWIIYQKPDYVVNSQDEVFIFTSTSKKCILIEEVGGKVGSMQHISPYSNKTARSIAFFLNPIMDSTIMRVSVRDKPSDMEPTASTYINSFVTSNANRWTIVMADSSRFCVNPSKELTAAVCVITNFNDNINTHPSGVQKVRQSCRSNDPGILIESNQCFGVDSGLNPIKPSWPFGPPPTGRGTGTTDRSCEVDHSNDILNKELRQLVEARLNGSLTSGDYITEIENPKNIWKTELFDQSYNIFTVICPDEVIDLEYMQMFSALYMYHLNKTWQEGSLTSTSLSLTEVDWMEINHDVRICLENLADEGFDYIGQNTNFEMKTFTNLKDIKDKIDKFMGFQETFDHVMEINWYIANLVASICSRALQYDVNFLPRFLNIYHELYFVPIMDQWKNPGNFTEIYPHIFGGYGMEKSLVTIALCAYNTMKASSLEDPYVRPMLQSQPILLPEGKR